jgi:hypothetical protein
MTGKGDRQRIRDRTRTTKAQFDDEFDRIFDVEKRLEMAREVEQAQIDEGLEEQEA